MIKRDWINELCEDSQDWLIEGLVCPWLTLLSGQPKHGKSLLAGHIAMALINEQPILGKEVFGSNHVVGWMGYDAGWKQEIKDRWSSAANGQIVCYDSIRSTSREIWRELAQALRDDGVTLFIIDHLYGLAGGMGLNDAEHFAILANLLRPIHEEFEIPILLLAQAGRSQFSNGRAAHSVAIEGEARALIRISDKRIKGARKLELVSNTTGEETLSITLTDEVVQLRESKSEKKKEASQRDSPDAVRNFLASANSSSLISWSAAGKEIHRLGMSVSADAGRTMTTRWREQGLMKLENGKIVAGDSLLDITVSNANNYAS